MAEPVITLQGVVRTFGEVTALDGVDLEVGAGEVVGFLGHNGAGKTTTVRCIAGLLPPDRGVVRVDGMDPTVDGTAVRQRLGVLPATSVVDGRLTARANLEFAADTFGIPRSEVDERVEAALARFDLQDRATEDVAGFSTGMQQRLSLARVLLPEPSILLLDEPTSALDPVAAHAVRDLLAELASSQQRTIVLCTHDLAEAEQLCDRVVVLERGRVVAAGSPAQLGERHGPAGLSVEVAPEHRDRAVRTLRAHTGTDPTVLDSSRLELHPVGRHEAPEVVRALVAAEVDVHQVRRLDPTLEDVYLALHRRDLADLPAPGGDA